MSELNETISNLRDGIQKLIWYVNSISREEFDEIMTFHNGGRKPGEPWLYEHWQRFRNDFLTWYANVDDELQSTIIEGALKKYL